MKRKATITAVVTGALMISGFASADWSRCESGHAHLFALFDHDDGVLSSDELPLSRVDRLFGHLDVDAGATITAEEVRNARHNRRDWHEGGWRGRRPL